MNNWISVKQRVPKPSRKNYLLFTSLSNTCPRKNKVYYGRYCRGLHGEKVKFWKYPVNYACCVTHWQPIPSPPLIGENK